MIAESVVAGATLYGMYRITRSEYFNDKKQRELIKVRWQVLMISMGNKTENKIEQNYDLLDLFMKHYGFDMIISIPFGKKFTDLLQLLPAIESCFKANVIMKLVKTNRNCAYVRVHYIANSISEKDKIKFDWFKTFYNIEGCITKSGDTLEIDSMSDIKSPEGTTVGYLVKSKIPLGLNYDKVKNSYDTITRTLGKCFLNFNHTTMELETAIIYKRIEDDYKFTTIDVKPWELYIAMGYDWKPIMLDYSLNANALIGGIQGSGKTNALIAAFTNLCSRTDCFDMFVCNIGEKEDLRVFRDVKQCKGYANTNTELIAMLKHLKKEVKRRNKLFGSMQRFCFNIHEYNKIMRAKKLPEMKVIHLVADEIADLMEIEESQSLLWDIIRKSRSSGIYVTAATQRGSRENISSEIKGQFANKICFSQPNTASALTIMSGEDVAKRVMSLEKKRECLVDYMEGLKVAKTLFLSPEMMEELLKDTTLPHDDSKANKLKLDANGNVIEETAAVVEDPKVQPEVATNGKDTPAKEEKAKKLPRFINLKQNKDKQKK